ncbi:universal stress protein [Allokutzneria sp. NRRL B-24872]|uniref:universal stress protein n=1 Tax=Allokutzneria sp. NRRL B-24872 TaxID=1137961 RepID=UPI000A396821|nr:universal stress protein [Allokutzneria sp. NRRL B-24872]
MSATTAVRSPGSRTKPRKRATRLTVGTDGSYWGDVALTWARRHATATDGDLRIVNRPEPNPLPALLAASAGSRMLVLGCRGERHRAFGLGALVLPTAGSARCDTLVVRGLWSAIAARHGRITAMVSGGDHDTAVLRSAAGLATAYGAELHVHARPHGGALDHARRWLAENAPAARTSLHPDEQSPHDAILRASDSDVLVLGRGATSHCGTVARFALHHAPCPVLVAGSSAPAS